MTKSRPQPHFEDGRFVCETPQGWLPMRTLHDLTRQVTVAGAPLSASVRVMLAEAEGGGYPTDGAAGMLVGVGRGEMDYRSAALVHEWHAWGAGMFAGINAAGQCFIVDNEAAWSLGEAGQAGGGGASNILTGPAGSLSREGWRVAADSVETDGAAELATDGDPDFYEFLWFEIKAFGEQTVEATLLSQPFDIAAMNEGDHGEHPVADLNDWGIMTALGMTTPRNRTAVRVFRENREEILAAIAEDAQ